MEITSLKLTNIRSIETAEFRFKPGFNLIVGVNGVGQEHWFWMPCASVYLGSSP